MGKIRKTICSMAQNTGKLVSKARNGMTKPEMAGKAVELFGSAAINLAVYWLENKPKHIDKG